MTETTTTTKLYKVAELRDEFTLVLNCGSDNDIKDGQRFLIYAIGNEIIDPDSRESLGKLEIVKGTGRVTHLQNKISTIRSDMKVPANSTIRKTHRTGLGTLASMFGASEIEEHLPPESKPFENPKIGDYAKPI